MGEDKVPQVTRLDEEPGSAGQEVHEDSKAEGLSKEHQACWGEDCELIGMEVRFWGKGTLMLGGSTLEGRVVIRSHVLGTLCPFSNRGRWLELFAFCCPLLPCPTHSFL